MGRAGDADKEDILLMGITVYAEAWNIFKYCGFPNDFGMRGIEDDCMIFGNYNRIRWSPRRGFWCDKDYHVDEFVKKFEEWQKKEEDEWRKRQ